LGEDQAAERCGRRARLLEYDPHYCDTIIKRWQALTGKQAKHEASGQAFDERSEQYLI
jgi:DNA modification methylase